MDWKVRVHSLWPDVCEAPQQKPLVRYWDKPHITMINSYWYLLRRGVMKASSRDLRDWHYGNGVVNSKDLMRSLAVRPL